MEVLIVGAGPTGLTAAVELARRGVVPTVIEKRPGPSPLSRAVGILPRSMEILRPSGVACAIDAEAVRFSEVRIHRGPRLIGRLPLNFDAASRIWGLAQDRTEAHLRDAFHRLGGAIRYDTALTGLAQDRAGVTAQTGRGEIRADRVIAADGARSTVREVLRIPYPGRDLPGDWSIADVEAPDWRHPTAFQGFLLDGHDVAVVVPLDAHRFRVISSRPDALAALPVRMEVAETHRTGAFTISVRQATRYRDGHVFLAGDAAHCHSPVGGRGMNLGIADAADLARRLVEGGLDGYGAARHPVGRHVIAISERGRRLVQDDWPGARVLLRAGVGAAAQIGPLGRAAARALLNA